MLTRNWVLFNSLEHKSMPVKYDLPGEFCSANLNSRAIQVLDFNLWSISDDQQTFSHAPGIRLHADFNYDSDENDRFVMIENNEGSFVHKKTYRYRSNQRHINIWFTDPFGNPVTIYENGKYKYAWYLDLNLIYDPTSGQKIAEHNK